MVAVVAVSVVAVSVLVTLAEPAFSVLAFSVLAVSVLVMVALPAVSVLVMVALPAVSVPLTDWDVAETVPLTVREDPALGMLRLLLTMERTFVLPALTRLAAFTALAARKAYGEETSCRRGRMVTFAPAGPMPTTVIST